MNIIEAVKIAATHTNVLIQRPEHAYPIHLYKSGYSFSYPRINNEDGSIYYEEYKLDLLDILADDWEVCIEQN